MKPGTLLTAALIALSAAYGYTRFGRPWVINWGARQREVEQTMAGDELLRDASLQTTRAITIKATPEHVWPWLLQMGPRPRAGVYTYDLIERLLGIDIKNSDRVMPEHQHLDVGDEFALNQSTGLIVQDVQPQRFLVLQWTPARSTWTFGLYPEDGSTRLVSRNRLPGSGLSFWLMARLMEPASLVMERKMLLGIKQRAEKLAAQAVQATEPPA
jgi:hypothetical protein